MSLSEAFNDNPSIRRVTKNDRLSILHVLAPGIGGLERVVQALTTGHHQAGHNVRVVAVVDPNCKDHPFFVPLRAAGVSISVLHLPPRAYMAERRSVTQICQEFRPDVVHTHGFRPDVLDAGAARALGFPTVTTVHGASLMGGRTYLYEWLQTRMFRRFDAVVVVSRELLQILNEAGVSSKRTHLIPNAWAGRKPSCDRTGARQTLGLSANELAVGWVGRLIHVKACDIFLKAIADLPELPLVVAIIGEGRERPKLETQAKSLGIDKKVVFYGSVADATDLFPAFDVYVLSSRSEGTPMVLFEAMAARTPIVATSVGGVPDVISPQEGILVPPDDPNKLAGGIRDVLRYPEVARHRATLGFDRLAGYFDLESWLRQYENLYRHVCRK